MSAPRPGFIHPSAAIGCPPEHRDWDGRTLLEPEISPTAQVNAFVTVDSGFWEPTRIGDRTFIMAHCHIAHDCQIGSDCDIAAGAVFAGHVTIGDGVRVGVNVSVRPFVKIGDGARIGAGAVVVDDVPAGETWVGNPAQRLGGIQTAEEMTELEREGWEEWWAARERDKDIFESPEDPYAA